MCALYTYCTNDFETRPVNEQPHTPIKCHVATYGSLDLGST